MPPHRALGSYDILFTIFLHLDGLEASSRWYDYNPTVAGAATNNGQRTAGRRTLAHCARVCHSFFHPAVSILWKDIDDVSQISTLLLTLTGRTEDPIAKDLECRRCPYGDTMRTTGPQADRILNYAALVRSVYGPQHSIALASCRAAIPRMNHDRLLPHLVRLRWTQCLAGTLDILNAVPSSLNSMHIIFRQPSGDCDTGAAHARRVPAESEAFVREFMRRLVGAVPKLRYLRLTSAGEVKESWLESVGELHELETLDILEPIYSTPTTLSLLHPLASLRNLQHLKLRIPESTLPLAADPFPSLRSLVLDCTFAPLSTASTFLSTITSIQLESLSLLNCECSIASLHPQLYELADVISAQLASSLRTIVFAVRGIGSVPAISHPLIKTIAPLLEVPHLREVDLTIAPQLAVLAASQDDLCVMCDAWPDLTRLYLSYFCPPSAHPRLCDLVSAVRRIPALQELAVPGIDASAVDVDMILEGLAVNTVPRNLRIFNLSDTGWGSTIPDSKQLARCLHELFPAEVCWNAPLLASPAWCETVKEVLRLRVEDLRYVYASNPLRGKYCFSKALVADTT
ncbi:hypothetical protein C2E23DRAFT_854458 [Lenzites betulinus]|nr:hypothetical protein C2E23DRAFT_854458 [Lenzites betulinus]